MSTRRERWTLPSTLDAPALARRLVSDRLAELHPEVAFTVRLLVSELVTNAVVHGAAPLVLRVRMIGPCLRIEVHDGSTRRPQLLEVSASMEHGRGLRIVDGLADQWGTHAARRGGK